MATSSLHQTTNSSALPLPFNQDTHYQPSRRSSGRRKCKGADAQKNRKPQRGMGVEKLERLRMEGLNNMTNAYQEFEINPLLSFADPSNMVTSSSSSPHGHLPKLARAPGVALMNNGMYLGVREQMSVGGLASDQLKIDLFGIGRTVKIIPRELSSTPNDANCFSENCNACHKKKKVNGQSSDSGGVRSDVFSQMPNVVDTGFLRLNIGSNEEMLKAPSVHPHQMGFGVGTAREERVEVVAVHRRVAPGGSGEGSLLMEYEFFPQQKAPAESDTSPTSSSAAGFEDYNFIDLSLKLSY